MRRIIPFPCGDDTLIGTLDGPDDAHTALLWVSGGNEIRSGAGGGQARMAARLADAGYRVLRYDRRGVGDSEGTNRGYRESAADMAAALSALRAESPALTRIVAFGNCDAASALALYAGDLPLEALILANPWTLEEAEAPVDNAAEAAPALPSAAVIRARYMGRLKNPGTLLRDLFSGRIDLGKLARGLRRAAAKPADDGLGAALVNAIAGSSRPVHLLLAEGDGTAIAFLAHWRRAHAAPNVATHHCATASHSFADADSNAWLFERLCDVLSAE